MWSDRDIDNACLTILIRYNKRPPINKVVFFNYALEIYGRFQILILFILDVIYYFRKNLKNKKNYIKLGFLSYLEIK